MGRRTFWRLGAGMSHTVTEIHDLKDTMHVEVETPGHAARGSSSSLFNRTKKALYLSVVPPFIPKAEAGRCFICCKSEEELGTPLEAHHFGVEFSFANAPILWDLVALDFPNFDWTNFDRTNPMMFVDNMQAQGLLLCKRHHTGNDSGIHTMPFGLWLMQRYLADGYKFSETELIDHALEAE